MSAESPLGLSVAALGHSRVTVFSACRTYRYGIWREWIGGDGYVLMMGLKPSTADERINDATLTRNSGSTRSCARSPMRPSAPVRQHRASPFAVDVFGPMSRDSSTLSTKNCWHDAPLSFPSQLSGPTDQLDAKMPALSRSRRRLVMACIVFATASIDPGLLDLAQVAPLSQTVWQRLTTAYHPGVAGNDSDPYRVFFSHGGEDSFMVEDYFGPKIRASGAEVFIDNGEILYGDDFREQVFQQLQKCDEFLILLTPSSVQRPWIFAELGASIVRGVRVVAIRYGVSEEDLRSLGVLSILGTSKLLLPQDTARYVDQLRDRVKGKQNG
jgi:hypothetical protein